MRLQGKTMKQRFFIRIQPVSKNLKTCWVAKKAKKESGYKRYTQIADDSGNKKYMHRVSWEIFHGKIPKNQLVLHKCDNPPCVNPNHLFLGDYSDNRLDALEKDRVPTVRKYIKTCKKGHLFSEHGRTRPDGKRYCFKCKSNLSIKDRAHAIANSGIGRGNRNKKVVEVVK